MIDNLRDLLVCTRTGRMMASRPYMAIRQERPLGNVVPFSLCLRHQSFSFVKVVDKEGRRNQRQPLKVRFPFDTKKVPSQKTCETQRFLHVTHRHTRPSRDSCRAPKPLCVLKSQLLGPCSYELVRSAQELYAIEKMAAQAMNKPKDRRDSWSNFYKCVQCYTQTIGKQARTRSTWSVERVFGPGPTFTTQEHRKRPDH